MDEEWSFDSLTGRKSWARKLRRPTATRQRNCSILKPLTSASILHRQGFSEVAVKVLGELFIIIGDYIMFPCTLRQGVTCVRDSAKWGLSMVFEAAKNLVDGVRAAWEKISDGILPPGCHARPLVSGQCQMGESNKLESSGWEKYSYLRNTLHRIRG